MTCWTRWPSLPGAALVVLVLFDLAATTLTLGEGAGPLTRRLLGRLWPGVLALASRGSRSKILSNAGPVLLALTVLIWVLATRTGWWLVLMGSDSIRSALRPAVSAATIATGSA